jgi:hypothetical protein
MAFAKDPAGQWRQRGMMDASVFKTSPELQVNPFVTLDVRALRGGHELPTEGMFKIFSISLEADGRVKS